MKKDGFTLVELLVVMAVLALVLFIAVPKVNDTIVFAKRESFKNSAIELGKAAEKLVAISWNDITKPNVGEGSVISFFFINKAGLVSNITGIADDSAVVAYNNSGTIEFYVFAMSSSNGYCVNGYRTTDIKDNVTVENHDYYTELLGNHTFSKVGNRLQVN